MPGGVQPIGFREAEVVLVELDKRRAKFRGAAQRFGKRIGLELETSTQNGHAE